MPDTTILKKEILQLADHCVKCGLCSTHCPTYVLNQDENESPRGRVSLAQAIALDAIKLDDKAKAHLNNCLQCRRCEAVCPSQVEYGNLINRVSQLIAPDQKSKKTNLTSFVSRLTHNNWKIIGKLYNGALRTGLFQLIRISTLGKQITPFLQRKPIDINKLLHITHDNNLNQTIFLFTGCTAHLFETRTIKYAKALLERCGYSVVIPSNQTCCGAIAIREGFSKIETKCQLDNINAFSDKENRPILFFTTGCGGKLKEYSEHDSENTSLADRAEDINHFLTLSKSFQNLTFSPLNKNVLVFNPCSERNVLKQTDVVPQLISNIPELTILNLPKNTGCCGASGTHLITHKEQAEQFLQPLLANISTLSPDLIISPNYPCSLHIQAGLKEKGLDIPVLHPIELLFDQLIV